MDFLITEGHNDSLKYCQEANVYGEDTPNGITVLSGPTHGSVGFVVGETPALGENEKWDKCVFMTDEDALAFLQAVISAVKKIHCVSKDARTRNRTGGGIIHGPRSGTESVR